MKQELIVEMLQVQNDFLKEFYQPQIEELEAKNKKLRLMVADKVTTSDIDLSNFKST